MSTVIDYWEGDSINNITDTILFDALTKMANLELEKIEELLSFKKRYAIKTNTRQLIKSRKKYKRFIRIVNHLRSSDCRIGDCIDGYGEQQDYQGSTYRGTFKNGLFEGEGTLEFHDGEKYTGSFHNGRSNGYGVYYWNDGSVYKGEWSDDQINGVGTMIWSDGDSIYAMWENGDFVQELETIEE